jgi:hypothetical protein
MHSFLSENTMALSAAERAKKDREDLKNNPTKYNDYLKQEKP